ncbi:hypothetical protein [Magnetospirillum moscoviense]|uniref:Uncharacterized protein n=1 Tax=Magnetospirillum moscoviense TaxID=1437059 RepID=A0A178M758_9PROT|nr:hypothetical protein [Magnetospirillum moscoviense]MBF0326728.1 hypothetical protein [Alphaproteobacteria bacterium]OAN44356.1 hypothetical protein A6A05_17590 [Magnetospirillum moscoviense]
MTIQFHQPGRPVRQEPMMSSTRDMLPPVIALPAPAPQPEPRFNLRHMSPRRFAEIAHELYLEGVLRWEEYQWIGYPSELHPDFDLTIGALTGEKAQPDRPRDMLGEIEDRIEFLKRHGGHQTPGFWRAERALDVLRRQGEPMAA